jgi:hypothetical protein
MRVNPERGSRYEVLAEFRTPPVKAVLESATTLGT